MIDSHYDHHGEAAPLFDADSDLEFNAEAGTIAASDTASKTGKDNMTADNSPAKILPAQGFQALGIEEGYLHRLAKQGIESPTEIQEQAIPLVFEGRDLVARAPTGSGKSAAFLLPILHRIWSDQSKIMLEPGAPRALVLVPTRELAAQLGRMARSLQPPKTTQPCEITGGVPYPPQFRLLDRPQPIMIATPGRLIDLMDDQRISLSLLEMLVLDEADRMLEMGFTEALDQVLSAAPKECQKVLFSATVPRWVDKAANRFLNDPASVEVGARHGNTPQIEQGVYYCSSERKADVLKVLLDDEALSKVVVFVNAKVKANELEKDLRKAGIKATSLHGDHNQSTRRKALARFRDDEVRVLVASDVAARGVDLPAVSHVINFDMPRELETYIHRIGRTGRAQQEGVAIALCDHFEMSMIRLIERKQGIEMLVLADELPPKAKRKKGKDSKHLRPEWSNKRQPRRGEEDRADRARASGFDPDDMARGDHSPERKSAGRSTERSGGKFAGKAGGRAGEKSGGKFGRVDSRDGQRPAGRGGEKRQGPARPDAAKTRSRKSNADFDSRAPREERFSDKPAYAKPGRRPARSGDAEGFNRQERPARSERSGRSDRFAKGDVKKGADRHRAQEPRGDFQDEAFETRAPRKGRAAGEESANRGRANARTGDTQARGSQAGRPHAHKPHTGKRGVAAQADAGPIRPKRQARRGSYIDDALDRAFGKENDEG